MIINFRTDASIEIGTGHTIRCLTLANAFREAGAECKFIIRDLKGHLAKHIQGQNFDVKILPAPKGERSISPPIHASWSGVHWEQDVKETREAIGNVPTDWLVLDHYAFDARWQNALKFAYKKLLVIDDLADRPHICDLLLDQNMGRNVSDYQNLIPEDTISLIGPKYALLRPEFSALRLAALANRDNRKLHNLLISLGGVDANDITSKILNTLRLATFLPNKLEITVVMGSKAPKLSNVKQLAETMPWKTLVCVDLNDMGLRMASADFAIGASGSTTWERFCLGLPTIMIQTADNQAGIVSAVKKSGASIVIDTPGEAGFEDGFLEALKHLSSSTHLSELSAKASDICDGQGVNRVQKKMIGITETTNQEYIVRLANMNDAKNVWSWRNAGTALKYYLSDKPTPLESHLEWFAQALENSSKTLLIIERGKQQIGHVRIDRRDLSQSDADISICVNPDYRGKGLGAIILENSINYGIKNGVYKFFAAIHGDNSASVSIFQKIGFKVETSAVPFIYMVLDKVSERSD